MSVWGTRMNILFWNIGLTKNRNKNLEKIHDCIREMLIENDVDLLILAEYPYDTRSLCQIVNAASAIQYKTIPNISSSYRIRGIINSNYKIESLQEQDRYQLVKIGTSYYELIVAMIHNISKYHNDPPTQRIEITQFYNDIADSEQRLNCDYTIAIGDFNINPFEEACIRGNAMHAIPFADVVLKNKSRKIRNKTCKTFYNPTWKFFANEKAPYTTYYQNRGQEINFYWYALDQVIVRPSLINVFDEKMLKIISQTNQHNLLSNGTPDKINYSDHLPLFCTLKEEKI